jgi:predicted nucleic acid-binding protein
MIQRVYIDTSVIGGCFDEEFENWSNKLFDEINNGRKIAVISDITYREIELAPKIVQDKLLNTPHEFIENIITDSEIEDLAGKYISAGVINHNHYEDALHIANATICKADILVSWNFKHIVNIDKIRKYNAVNLMFGYSVIEIRTPREILINNQDEIEG